MTQGIKFFTIAFLSLTACHLLSAQLCQGSLGDPIVNITFGSGSNPGPQLAAATTAYQYVSYDCPNDGYYTVRNSTNGCFQSSWHNLGADHTGDPSGYFMLVNASIAPSAFYLDTVRGLCGNTTYEFAAWVINVLQPTACQGNGIEPNLTFSIEKTDGTILQSYNTNNIPTQQTPTWQQFGFFFTTPSSVSDVVLRIFNNSEGGCGNDLALDDITFRPCGPIVTVAFDSTSNNTEHICKGTAKTVTLTSSLPGGFGNYALQWQKSPHNGVWTDIPGETGKTLTQFFADTVASGVYDYRVAAASPENINSVPCRIASVILFVQVDPLPAKSATNNGPACENGTLILSALSGTNYAWSGPGNFSSTLASPMITPVKQTAAGTYYVQVTDASNCTLRDSTTVLVNPAPVASTTFTNATICSGNSIQLISEGVGAYAWLPAAGLSSTTVSNPVASPLATTTYVVTVTNQFACTDTASVVINVNETPTANAGPDKTIIAGNLVTLQGTATGGDVSYLWSPAVYIDSAQILQPTVKPSADITYTLTVTSVNGCGTATDSMHVFVYKGIYIPSAFTPNGDGLNDTWSIPALNAFPSFELSIFNRYGQLVFKNQNANVPWDGTYKGAPATAGAYVYVIDLKQPPGILKGSVLLIR